MIGARRAKSGTFAWLAAAFAMLASSAAQSQDRSTGTEWTPEALAAGAEMETRQDQPFLQALLSPPALIVLDTPARTAEGSELTPAGSRFFRLKTRTSPVFCTIGAGKRWGEIRRIVAVHLCLVDDNGDGSFDTYYVERGDHAFLPLFRGTFPAERRALAPLTFSQRPPQEISILGNGIVPPRAERLSTFLMWDGPAIRCYIGYPRYRIFRVPLYDFALVPRRESLPATMSVCGTSLRILSRDRGVLRFVPERTYPVAAREIGLQWQLF